LLVGIAGLRVREAVVGELNPGGIAGSEQLDGENGPGTFGAAGAGHPGEFDQAPRVEAEEPAVVGIAAAAELRLEVERGVQDRLHQD
jgi:hypothetical protein